MNFLIDAKLISTHREIKMQFVESFILQSIAHPTIKNYLHHYGWK